MESLIWSVLLAGMISWLVYLLWLHRRDNQLVVLVLIPFLVTFGNMVVGSYISRGMFPGGYLLPDWNLGFVGGLPLGPYQISMVLWPLLFYVFWQRQIRWVGLLLYSAPISLMNLLASTSYLQIAVIWTIPIMLVLAVWMIDLLENKSQARIAA